MQTQGPQKRRQCVCSLPMRDWNGKDFGCVEVPCYQFVAYLWGIETISGIRGKPYPHWFVAYLWGIETAKSDGPLPPYPHVCSLPMRDWNRGYYHWPVTQSTFVAYLWGIETLWDAGTCRTANTVCSLPMRDWNSISKNLSTSGNSRL